MEHPMFNSVQAAKQAFANGDKETAMNEWIKIYDFFDKKLDEIDNGLSSDTKEEIFKEQNKLMQYFTDDEVYGITDYYKQKFGY